MERKTQPCWKWGNTITRFKNSKGHKENLKEMERNVKQMLKLIEDNGDSFAQKAEMYYKKRPELISLVEEFYRGYKSLVERYDLHTTPCDVQSQASGMCDNGSEPPSYVVSPRKMLRRISPNRAAGFDVFLGSPGRNVNDFDSCCQKDGDNSSTLTSSDDDYDDTSSSNSFTGFFGNGRVMELDIENTSDDFRAKVNAYEQELRNVNEKLRLSEGEIGKMKIEIEKYKSMESENLKGVNRIGLCSVVEGVKIGGENLELKKFAEELKMTKEKLESSERQIVSLKFGATKTFETIQQLQEQLDLAEKDIASWKAKFNTQKRENSKLQEKLAKMRTSIVERDNEIRDLKTSLSDVEEKIFFERANKKSEMSKLMGKQTLWEKKIKEWECQCQSLKEEIRKIQIEKIEMGERLKGEIEGRKKSIEDVNKSLDGLKLERDNLKEEVGSLKEVISSRDNEIGEAHKQVEELTSRGKKLEEQIERQRVEIIEGAEEKREAIRQLCFSLECYRNDYNLLRQAFIEHKRVPVLAAYNISALLAFQLI